LNEASSERRPRCNTNVAKFLNKKVQKRLGYKLGLNGEYAIIDEGMDDWKGARWALNRDEQETNSWHGRSC